MRWLIPALLCSLMVPCPAAGLTPDSVLVIPDSILAPAPPSDAAPVGYRPTKSPGTALLLSALLPGAGQVYNESYWKAPVILGVGLYFTSQWLHYNRLTDDARRQYDASFSSLTDGDPALLRLREFYKDQRDSYTWYFFLLYLVNLADAYVDASLYDFSVSDDLTVRVMPDAAGRVVLRLNF